MFPSSKIKKCLFFTLETHSTSISNISLDVSLKIKKMLLIKVDITGRLCMKFQFPFLLSPYVILQYEHVMLYDFISSGVYGSFMRGQCTGENGIKY